MSSTLFGATTPAILNADDGNTYVLGTQFTPNVNGTATHARRYFPTTPQAGVSMGLYRTSDQVLLGSVNFPDGTAAGWQQQAFVAPVALVAGISYQIVYFTVSRYVATSAYGFPFTSGDLTAGAVNGVFNASVPALQYATGNLGGTAVFADIVFEPAGVGGTVTSDLDLRWAVQGSVSSDLDLRWAVRGTVTSDLDLRWGVGGQVSSDLDLRWQVLAEAPEPVVRQGSWYQLLDAYKLDQEYRRDTEMLDCPRCGEPWSDGPAGQIYCLYCGYRPHT